MQKDNQFALAIEVLGYSDAEIAELLSYRAEMPITANQVRKTRMGLKPPRKHWMQWLRDHHKFLQKDAEMLKTDLRPITGSEVPVSTLMTSNLENVTHRKRVGLLALSLPGDDQLEILDEKGWNLF
ncbi:MULTISPECIES: hypothetical protein [unclassified Hyphomonas]|jgi:hypothetical protein|uniref:hypothetical protein n=1 Tax=unclassified Hyphomonas TaxID=2630699 RepID=UPI000E81E947|nr:MULTISPECIES: hypothetical protein [unclassified Hyphomonas]HAW53855.1 hypothetical protein [Hyphomonas sp.]HBJ41057.1 hypothetical protein [Hyphomonas sp.]HBT36911.1 hypothetical protein [Hyphomonas sp.]HBX93357.1 hypothetical protein [Hyphomonas sp.]HCE24415.1 hypothetical protein [Hyphomonas sp.]|tara:strand:- start:965 stop:1342 length:378 start_codon:yes stop_codon:yes gene_type:complete